MILYISHDAIHDTGIQRVNNTTVVLKALLTQNNKIELHGNMKYLIYWNCKLRLLTQQALQVNILNLYLCDFSLFLII